jgi:hypothetical protein
LKLTSSFKDLRFNHPEELYFFDLALPKEPEMTRQKHEAIKNLIERQTRLKTASKEVAREFLFREGIYTKEGHLSSRFGGSADHSHDQVQQPKGRKQA